MSVEEKRKRYQELLHAMQTGVQTKMNYEDKDTQPKHLRVGINAAMSDHAALVYLLVRKGLITEEEYFDSMIEFMEREVESYRALLHDLLGANITLL